MGNLHERCACVVLDARNKHIGILVATVPQPPGCLDTWIYSSPMHGPVGSLSICSCNFLGCNCLSAVTDNSTTVLRV